MNTEARVDINEIIFLRKNKEYGAYILRKLYSKFLTYAVIIACSAFTLAVSSPLIIAYLKPKEEITAKKKINLLYTELAEPPSIDKKQEVVPVDAPPPLKSTMKFTPPVIKPDEQVVDEYIPTQEELKTVDPGTKTQQGDPTGVDYSLIDVEEEEAPVEEVKEEKPEVFTFVEEMPSFPGGNEAFLSYVASNIQYPEIAKRAGVEGKIFVSFIVGKDGGVSNVEVVKGIGAGCDEEAVRVIRSMPKWNPGKQNGRPVLVKVSVPIIFRLQ